MINPTRAGIYFITLILILFGLLLSQTQKESEPETIAQTSDKIVEISRSNKQGEILPGTTPTTYYYKFYLKDASVLGVVLPGTTEPDSSLISGATVEVLNQSSFTCGDFGSDYAFTESNGFYKLICQETGEMQIRISKSGYDTKTTSLGYYQGEIPTIYLSKYVPPPPPPPETIKDVTLPKVFQQKGSNTTDLSKISDPKKVGNLTIEVKNKNKVVWNETVDLSSTDTRDKFKTLNKYLKADQLGIFELDSKKLKILNKKATITMFSLPFVSTPKILVNGKENPEVISGISYKDGALNFKTAHFSKLEAVPTLEITKPQKGFQTEESEVILKGVVTDPQAKVTASLNNRNLGELKVATQSGQFSKPITLIVGFNSIMVSAESSFGATLSATVSGEFVPKKFNYLWIVGSAVVVLIIATFGGGTYYWYKRRKTKIAQPEKPPQI